MNKFVDKPKKEKKVTISQIKKITRKGEIITKGKQTFIICPKCGWIHPETEKKCRFCGAEL